MSESTTTRSIERAFDILECFLGETQEFTLKELVSLTNLSPSTVHRLIKALEKRNYLMCDTHKKYRLGSMVSQLGFVTAGKMGLDFKMIARKYMIELHQKYNESVSLYVIDDNKRLCIDRIESTHELRRVIDIGSTFPLEVGAAGRILLAFLDQDSIDDMYLDVNISSQEYQKIRREGFLISEGEREIGVSALAVPIFNFTKKIIATLALSGPTVRLDKKILSEIAQDLKNVSEKISKELGYFKDQ